MWYNLYVYFETCWFGDCKENYKTKFIKIYFHFDKLFRMKFTSVITISYQFLTLKTWKIFSLNHTHIKPSTSVLKSLFPDRFQCVRNAQPIRHASFNIVHLLLLCVLFHRELYVNMFFSVSPYIHTSVYFVYRVRRIHWRTKPFVGPSSIDRDNDGYCWTDGNLWLIVNIDTVY